MYKKEKIQVIKGILLKEFSSVYCDSCDGGNCYDCNRKQMNWGLSEDIAEYIAERILNIESEDK